MFWILFAAYFLGSLPVSRRVAYMSERWAHRGHEFQSICTACRCKNCNGTYGHHFKYRSLSEGHCDNFEFKYGIPHARTMFLSLAAWLVWPVVVLGYMGMKVSAMAGRGGSFYVKPKPIETKEQKQIRELQEREAEIARRELELGIEPIYNSEF